MVGSPREIKTRTVGASDAASVQPRQRRQDDGYATKRRQPDARPNARALWPGLHVRLHRGRALERGLCRQVWVPLMSRPVRRARKALSIYRLPVHSIPFRPAPLMTFFLAPSPSRRRNRTCSSATSKALTRRRRVSRVANLPAPIDDGPHRLGTRERRRMAQHHGRCLTGARRRWASWSRTGMMGGVEDLREDWRAV